MKWLNKVLSRIGRKKEKRSEEGEFMYPENIERAKKRYPNLYEVAGPDYWDHPRTKDLIRARDGGDSSEGATNESRKEENGLEPV